MNFFNIGPMELMLILVIALLVFGPRRLPEIARDLGKAIRDFQRASQELEKEIQKGLDTVEGELQGSAQGTSKPAEDEKPQTSEPEGNQDGV
jgi:TatA/E family protein of Tat protein translocase